MAVQITLSVARLKRSLHRFARKHTSHAQWPIAGCAMVLPQPLAKRSEQGVVGHAGQIGHIDGLRLLLATCCPHGHEGGAGGHRPGGKSGLGTHLIAGVDQGIHRARQQGRPVGLIDEFFDRYQTAARVNVDQPLAQGERLGLPDGAAGGLYLPVDVAFGDVVQIDEGQRSHATSRERFSRPRADTAQADERHACAAQLLVAGTAMEPPQATKPALEIRITTVRIWLIALSGPLAHLSEARRSLPATAASEFG